MSRKSNKIPENTDSIAAAAATWVMRHDRGLSPEEQDHYLEWLASDPRHAAAMASQRRAWEAFDRLAGLQAAVEAVPDPDLLAPPVELGARRFWKRIAWATVPFAAAAAIALSFWPGPEFPAVARAPAIEARAVAGLAPIEERTLADGSIIRLNRGAAIVVEYSTGERRVRLHRGEAAFDVAKDATRPFVVLIAGVAVRAVGTAFNVRLGEQTVDVIVTEGRVAVASGDAAHRGEVSNVVAGQRAVVLRAPTAAPPVVSTPPPEELARRLAWQPRMLTFADEPLAVILNEFNRHNPVALRIDDPALQDVRLSARFRSDNVPGFLRLLESDFRVRAEPQVSGEIVLRAAR